MDRGKISYWNAERGFGFVLPDAGGERVFCHATQLRSGAEPREGDSVEFEIGTSERTGKSEAQRVTVL